MTGAFLIGFFILAVLLFLISFMVDSYDEEGWRIVAVVSFILGVILLIVIPMSRIGSKTNAEYAKIFQQTLDYNRSISSDEQKFNVFERTSIIEEVNSCNSHINAWRIKGQKWYNNKWYYHPDTQKVELIK